MFIAMNRFHVIRGSEADFETVWTSRDTHLRDVPGFIEMADVLASRIRGAEYHRVPDAGHMVNMEAPEIINALLAAFLSRIHSVDHRSPD